MKNRHSMQIKQLLQKKRLSKSRFNPQSRIVVTSPSMKQSRQIKKSQSSSSLHVEQKKYIELNIMQKRYEDLYKEYLKIAQQAKKRSQLCKKQQDQIFKYEKAGQRDKKEIQMLKSMIGFVNKRQNGTQTILIPKQDIFDKHTQNKPLKRSQSYDMLGSVISQKKQKSLKQSRSRKDLSSNTKKSYLANPNDQNSMFNTRNIKYEDCKVLNKSRTAYPTLLNSSKQYDTQKRLLKRFESSKLAQSLLYGSKSTVDFKKKKIHHLQKNQDTLQTTAHQTKHSRINYPNSRINSPNSRFKFIPSVQL